MATRQKTTRALADARSPKLAILCVTMLMAAACGEDSVSDGPSTAVDAGGNGEFDSAVTIDVNEAAADVPEVDTAALLAGIGQGVKENGLFTQLVGVGGNPNTSFHACSSAGVGKTYVAGSGGTIVGHDGLSWKTLTEGTFATLHGISTAPGGDLVHAVGLNGTIIQAKGSAGKIGSQWGPPGGCKSSNECNDGDSCTADYCETGVCKHVPSKAKGCCGSIPLSDAFNNVANWTIADTFAASTSAGGIVWTAASVTSPIGDARWTSPKKSLYFGIPNKPCTADPTKTCPTYNNGKVVGSTATSEWMQLPKSAKITLTFQLYMSVRDSYPDDLRVRVLEPNGAKKDVWTKLKDNSYKGSTGGKFALQTVDLSQWSGKNIRLQLDFHAKYFSTTAMGGEGVFIDDLILTTHCGSGELASKGLSDATFFDTWAVDDKTAWAVGTGGSIARWDGKTWLLETGGPVRDVHAFAGVPGVLQLLVGQKGLVAQFGPTGMKPYDHKATTADLWDIAITPNNDVTKIHAVAVGVQGTVLELDQGAWKKTPFPIPFTLKAVAADGNGGYIVGASTSVYRRNKGAATWTPAGSLGQVINDTAFIGAGKYLVIGNSGKNAEVTSNALIKKTDVSQFALRSAWALGPKDVWMVGDQATIAHFNGSTWKESSKPFTQHLRGVWAANSQDVFAVGLLGTMARYDGKTWKPMDGPKGIDWYAVWGTDPNDVYAAGKGGILARYNGLAWTVIGGPVKGTLRGVWASGPKDVWAVGSAAAIYHSKGDGSWTPVAIEPYPIPDAKPKVIKEDLYAIWGSGPKDVWAIGSADKHGEATLVHWDGKTWKFIPALGTEGRQFRAIWGWHQGSVLFVGTQGMVYHYNGSEFRELKSGSITTFYDVCNLGKDALLVGGIGTVVRYIPPADFRKPPGK